MNEWMNGMKSNEMNGGSTCQCREPRRLTYRHVMLLLDGANLVRYLVTNCINVYTKFLDSWSCHSMIIVIMDRLLFSVKTVITIYWSNDVASMRNVSNSYTRSIQKNTMRNTKFVLILLVIGLYTLHKFHWNRSTILWDDYICKKIIMLVTPPFDNMQQSYKFESNHYKFDWRLQ